MGVFVPVQCNTELTVKTEFCNFSQNFYQIWSIFMERKQSVKTFHLKEENF